MPKYILVVDDEQDMLDGLNKILSRRSGYQLKLTTSPSEALKLLKKESFDLILTDLRMKSHSGMDILNEATQLPQPPKVIIISGYGTIDSSVEAMRLGAFDFLEKPFSANKLFSCIDAAFDKTDNNQLHQEATSASVFEGIIYQSNEIKKLLQVVKRIAANPMHVLITGESGTGKELFARAIHSASARNQHPFVPVNCGALPENLFESEIFGYERGAFTGAQRTKPGLLEFANSGSFFLDEIGDLSPALQVKLLRMLESNSIRRVGGTEELPIDVRIIAATNKSLEKLVKQELFREDLYYRLMAMHLEIPPLRERQADILPLARHFLQQICTQNGDNHCRLTPDAEEQLISHSWPGNVRELQNAIQRAFFLRSTTKIEPSDLPLPQNKDNFSSDKRLLQLSYHEARDKVLADFEVAYLNHHLKIHKGNISKTADACQLDRRSIHRLIKRHNIVFRD